LRDIDKGLQPIHCRRQKPEYYSFVPVNSGGMTSSRQVDPDRVPAQHPKGSAQRAS
jgi:hypothetical protein